MTEPSCFVEIEATVIKLLKTEGTANVSEQSE